MTFTFVLTQEFTNVVSIALGELPYKVSAPVIAEMQKQINEQEAKVAGNVVQMTAKPEAVEAESVANGAAS